MRRLLLVLFAVLIAAMAGPVAAAPVRIVAAENFYGDVAQQIAGELATVTSILSNPDEDPHLFESSASTARALADTDIVIYNGAGYDPWMDKLLSASTNADRKVIVAAELEGKKDGDNPHLWYLPATLHDIAAALAMALESRDPANAMTYSANLEKFESSYARAIAGLDQIKAQYAGTAVTATEPVFGYMADAMGLKMLNLPFQIATMNEAEPAPSDVASFEDSLKSGTAKILFYNSQVTDDTTTRLLALAKASNVPVIGVTETEPAGQTVQSWFAGQIAAVQASLTVHH